MPPLESSKKQNQTEVIPVTPPSSGSDPAIKDITFTGPVSGNVSLQVVQPIDVTGHIYEISFFDSLNPPYGNAQYWRLVDTNLDMVLLDSMANIYGTTYDVNAITPIVDGVQIDFDVEIIPIFSEDYSGWLTDNEDEFVITTKSTMEPYDFELQFPDFPNNVDTDTNNVDVSYRVFNTTLSDYHQTRFYDIDGDGLFSVGDSVSVFGMYTSSGIFSFEYAETGETDSLQAGDVFQVTTEKPFQVSNRISYRTEGPANPRATVDLNQVKVVPNPYYIRADWDENKYTNHIMFTNLPEKCTIKIFTVSGILIKEITHDAFSGDSNSMGGAHTWNLRNKEELRIASGLYIFQVDSDHGDYVGKFVVVR